jgi:RNA polymerase sigma factor (TIGR02999 family)
LVVCPERLFEGRDERPNRVPFHKNMRETPANLQRLFEQHGAQTMPSEPPGEVTRLLEAIRRGESGAADRLVALIRDELHNLARGSLRHERAGHTLTATDLIHEVFLRLLEGDVLARAENRAHLFGVACRALDHVLVDHARRRAAHKHGGDWKRTPLDDVLDSYESKRIDLVALHEALETLGTLHPRQRQVVEEYHFGGFTLKEIAEHLGVSEATVCGDLQRARLWLAAQMGQER